MIFLKEHVSPDFAVCVYVMKKRNGNADLLLLPVDTGVSMKVFDGTKRRASKTSKSPVLGLPRSVANLCIYQSKSHNQERTQEFRIRISMA